MNKKHIFKRVIAFMIVLISTLTLTACKKDKLKVPYGSLDNTVFLSGDGYSITKKQLYEEMRVNDISTLEKLIDKIIYADEVKEVLENREDFKQDFIDITNDKIFYTDDVDKLKELKEDELKGFVSRFVDLLFLEGVTINPNDVDVESFEDHSETIFEHYIINVAKKNFARKLLEDDVVDEESDYFIDKAEDIETYFKNRVKKRYPLSSINIRFTNSYEANQTLRHFNLKTYRSQWYLIADPRVTEVTGYSLEVLEDLGLADKNGELTESEHQKFYDKYVINPSREPTEDADVVLTEDEVIVKFFEIYNFVYPYKNKIDVSEFNTLESVLNSKLLVNDDEEDLGQFTMLYDDYPSAQSSFRTYIYDTLSVEEDGTKYTASPRSYGNFYFISFKLADHNEEFQDYLDEDDEFIIWENEDEEILTEYSLEYYEEIKKDKLTDNYVQSKTDEKLEETKITVYDEVLYLHLKQKGLDVKLSKKFNNDLVLEIGDDKVEVDELYALLEDKIGSNVAMDLALKEILKNSSYMDEITNELMKQYKDNVEDVIRQFSNNAFESSGLPASLGRKAFLRLSFRSETIDEAVEKIYVHSKLEELFYNDIERLYGEEIYQTFTDYANQVRDQYFSITASHLLIYVDMDEDDEPDNPEEFFETLKEDQVLEYKNMVTELMQLIHDRASKHSQFADGLQSVVDDFNASTKFRTDACDAVEGIEYRPECTWAKFRRAGFFLKFEELGDFNNSTNNPDSGGGYDKKFYERLQVMYHEIKDEYYELDKKFPSQILDNRPITYDGDDEARGVLETSFGWHLILATDGKVAKSSKFEYKDDSYIESDDADRLKIYEEIILKDRDGNDLILDAYNEEDALANNQVRIFLAEINSDRGVTSLPSKVIEALNEYLDPLKTKFENNYMRMHMLYKLFSESNFEYKDLKAKAKLDSILEINQRQFLDYQDEDNKLYFELYGQWFDIFA